MTECSRSESEGKATTSPVQLTFPFFDSLKLTVDFEGGLITSDAGLVFIREQDERQGLCRAVVSVMSDPRDQRYVDHQLLDLLRQRVYQIAAGYEDANDADDLRKDPAFKATAASRTPRQDDLASQPTLSRWENQPDEYELERIMAVFVDKYLTRRKNPPNYIILDIDPTDDPCHGAQQMALFHGYYDEKIYHQLLIFDGDTGELIVPILRPGSVHGADGVIEVLDWLLQRIVAAWPETQIIVRADGGLASPKLYQFLEKRGIWYVIGLITNNRLREQNAESMKSARSIFEITGLREQVFCGFDYQAGSWDHPRRVIGKAELLEKGANQRFVVTNVHEATPLAVYDFYRRRGEDAENRIKEFKNMMHGDRLSCHNFFANWFRLLLHAMAYELIRGLREHLAGTEYEKSTMETIRLKLIKVGARIHATTRRLWFHCPTGYPNQQIWINLHARLCAG